MRIRFLAAAAVTAGVLMTTLTGAANAAGTPSPAGSFEASGASGLAVPAVPATPPDGTLTIACKGGKGFAARAVTEAELERLRAGERRRVRDGDAVPAVPGRSADGPSEVRVPERGEVVHREGPDEVRASGRAVRVKRLHGKPHCVKAFPGKGSCEVVKGRAVPAPRHGSSGSFHSSGPEDVVRVRELPGKPAVVCVTELR